MAPDLLFGSLTILQICLDVRELDCKEPVSCRFQAVGRLSADPQLSPDLAAEVESKQQI